MTPTEVYDYLLNDPQNDFIEYHDGFYKRIGITRKAFYVWKRRKFIPYVSQKKIELLTKGKLVASTEDIPRYAK